MLVRENEPLFGGGSEEMEEGNQVLLKFFLGFLGLLSFGFGFFFMVF